MAWPLKLAATKLYRGDTRVLVYRFWTDDTKTVGADMTAFGSVFTAQVRQNPDATVEIPLDVDASLAAGGMGQAGQFTITIHPADWAVWPAISVGWDLQAANSDSSAIKTLIASRFTVDKDFTHV